MIHKITDLTAVRTNIITFPHSNMSHSLKYSKHWLILACYVILSFRYVTAESDFCSWNNACPSHPYRSDTGNCASDEENACTSDSDCCTNSCTSNTCQVGYRGDCQGNSSCVQGLECSKTEYSSPRCLLPQGSSCKPLGICVRGYYCNKRTETCEADNGAYCEKNSQCGFDVCQLNKCKGKFRLSVIPMTDVRKRFFVIRSVKDAECRLVLSAETINVPQD